MAKQMLNEEFIKMQKLAGIIAESQINEELKNDDAIYNKLIDMDHEQLISTMMSAAEDNPSITLVDFLNEYSYEEEV